MGANAYLDYPSRDNNFHEAYLGLAFRSFKDLTRRDLLDEWGMAAQGFGQRVFEGDYCLLIIDPSSQKKLTYATDKALRTFEMNWKQMAGMPSALTALEEDREERAALLRQVEEKGYAENYRGRRVTRNGNLFWIENVTVWNMRRSTGQYCGQVACFSQTTPIP